MTRSTSLEKIWGSLIKAKSGEKRSMKCLRLKMFLRRPSKFHVIVEKDVNDILKDEDASTVSAVDLSEPRRLNPAQQEGYLG